MTSSIQGILIALLIAFLIGILVGYSFVRSRMKQQAEALKVSQRRLEEIEQSHELRLREATAQLRQEYENELAETIEHYQDQLSQKAIEMEQIYETRFRVLQRGDTQPAPDVTQSDALQEAQAPTEPAEPQARVARLPSRGYIEPLPDKQERDRPPSQAALLHLKKQYEARLKDAVQKLQSAYEQQLSNHAASVRENLQAEYQRRVATKEEEYSQQFAARKAQLEEEYAERQEALALSQDVFTGTAGASDPNEEIMVSGDETTMTLQSPVVPKAIPQQTTSLESTESAQASAESLPENFEDRIQQAVEDVRQQYEQQLAERLTEKERQLEHQLQTVKSEYQRRIEELSASTSIPSQRAPSSQTHSDEEDSDFQPFDLSDLS